MFPTVAKGQGWTVISLTHTQVQHVEEVEAEH